LPLGTAAYVLVALLVAFTFTTAIRLRFRVPPREIGIHCRCGD
jgi:hypothetical protein